MMKFNYKVYQQNVGKNKIFKFLGWFFLIAGIVIFITSTISSIEWNTKKSNYTKEYIYSENGTLSYELNSQKVYVTNVYNTDNENITVNIPNNKIVIMYINKENINEGIYFDIDNTSDQNILNPTMTVVVSLFLISVGSYFVLTAKEVKENNITTKPLFLIYILLFFVGVGLIGFQVYNAINYFNLKSQNNVTTATIYTEIYSKGTTKDMYKPVAYYYIDGQKYIYVNSIYEKGKIDDKIGDTFKVYYEKNNPNKVINAEKPINIQMLIIGIAFTVFAFPFVFFRNTMEKRVQKNMLKKDDEWKI